ncbi:MAG TPA: hypothetical protein DDZ83_15665 [Nitrospinae bacterium]|nr:hypothetical protein [Nitrospinota bacterium]
MLMAALPVFVLALAAPPCSVHALGVPHGASTGHTQPVSGPDSHDECIAQAVRPGAPVIYYVTIAPALALPAAPVQAVPEPRRIFLSPIREACDPLVFIYPSHERSPPLEAFFPGIH